MNAAQQKLARHRERRLKGGHGAAAYSKELGIAPQRIARLLQEGAQPPTLREAITIQRFAKIKPQDWLD